MIKDHLGQLRNLIEQAGGLPDATRNELLKLVSTVENETSPVEGQPEEAAEPSDETPTQDSFAKLSSSIEELETSHPEMVTVVNRIAVTLGNMGI